jgi:hypothetical protein
MCFGNILPSLNMVYTKMLNCSITITIIYIFLILFQTIVDMSEFVFTVKWMQWCDDVTVPIFVGMHYHIC